MHTNCTCAIQRVSFTLDIVMLPFLGHISYLLFFAFFIASTLLGTRNSYSLPVEVIHKCAGMTGCVHAFPDPRLCRINILTLVLNGSACSESKMPDRAAVVKCKYGDSWNDALLGLPNL